MKVLVTGGSGFIGSALVKKIIYETDFEVINLDNLTYSAVKNVHDNLLNEKRYIFIKGNICDKGFLEQLFLEHRPKFVMNLAAETHVDNSIDDPYKFIKTNILGTFNLLNVSLNYLKTLNPGENKKFRFLQVSTDEVFGDLKPNELRFSETHPYKPSSPYAATKASADHLVRSWGRTYDFPYLISNCSNNFGPFQNSEKLIPKIIINAIEGRKIPIYGDGKQIRDWLYVEDHVDALLNIIFNSEIKQSYNIGSNNEITNIDLTLQICEILDQISSKENLNIKSFKELITHVEDRPGHDMRYAINPLKINKLLNWKPSHNFSERLYQTVQWYVKNR